MLSKDGFRLENLLTRIWFLTTLKRLVHVPNFGYPQLPYSRTLQAQIPAYQNPYADHYPTGG